MKARSLGVLLSLLLFQSSAQSLMTIGDVFDFNIGDEFQYYDYNLQSPNRDRITVIDKTIGANSVTYQLAHDSYYTVYTGNPGLDYVFWTDTETVNYYFLSSPISAMDPGFNYDTIIEQDACGADVNGYDFCDTSQFEMQCYFRKYTRGIGITTDYFVDYTQWPSVQTDLVLTYYKKDTSECGIRDNSTLSIPELSSSKKKELIRIVDLMGRETEDKPNTLLIYVYNDGTTEKVFRIK